MIVDILQKAGDFAEDKDLAAEIRRITIQPEVSNHHTVTLDFSGVNLVTQSFIHALIADVLRTNGERALKHIIFKGCSVGVRGIIETVVQYSLETADEDGNRRGGGT
jgi:hypothetical protein